MNPEASPLATLALGSSESMGLAAAVGLVVVLALLLPAAGRRTLRQPVLFIVLHLGLRALAAVVPAGGEEATARRILSFGALALLLAAIGRCAVLLVFDVVVGRRQARPPPRIVSDIAVGVVYAVVLLTALRAAGVEPGSILTTSALLTAAIALSLQETLGNMVAGLAIQVERPFDEGDWIQFDAEPKHIGKVLEINWRATKVITLDEVIVVVPNATLAKAAITNFTKPTSVSRRSLYIQVPADVPPARVHEIILGALAGSFGVVSDPAPSVVTNAFLDGNVEYWIRFFTDRFDKRDGVDGAARDRVWYALGRRGIAVASPSRAVALREVTAESREREEASRLSERADLLRRVDFLTALSDAQRATLARRSMLRMYAAGETIVRQGDDGAEMYLVHDGKVAVVREKAGQGDAELAQLGPGMFFGEMALVTGERRTATVRAAVACSMLVIDHEALREVLASAPHLAEHISQVIAERQASASPGPESARTAEVNMAERSSLLLGRIRRFFAL